MLLIFILSVYGLWCMWGQRTGGKRFCPSSTLGFWGQPWEQVPSLDGRLLWELFVVIVFEASSYSVLQYSLELSSHSPQHLGVNLPAVCLFKFTFDGIEFIHIIAQRIFILQN